MIQKNCILRKLSITHNTLHKEDEIKGMTKLFLFLIVALLLGGCATTGPKFTEYAPSISHLAPDTGRIYLYRTSVLEAAIQPEVKLNGEVIGKAVPNGFFYVDKKAGN